MTGVQTCALPIYSEQQQVNDVLLQFELTGLARLGDVPDSPLRQSVFAPSKGFGSGPLR